MANGANHIETAKQYMRRRFTLSKLETLADELWDIATDDVTITSQGFEGGNASGVLTFPKIDLLQAVEELILEKKPDSAQPGGRNLKPNFAQRIVQT